MTLKTRWSLCICLLAADLCSGCKPAAEAVSAPASTGPATAPATTDAAFAGYQNLAGELAAQIQTSAGGIVAIPVTIAPLDVVGGRIFVSKAGKSTAVLFPTWVGKGSNLRGLIFISGDAADFVSQSHPGETKIKVWVPAPTDSGTFMDDVNIMPTSDQHWFKAEVAGD